MPHVSKVCDAADWFDPEVQRIIREELQEPAKFHRKQWEFAMIFHALQQYGYLTPDKTGISFGGGTERVLYAIARHVRELVVTDLYDSDTSWDCARTADPDAFVKAHKPFPVDDAKFRALRMDMRYPDFAENSFHFAYSSCALEHIGAYDDFLQHLNQVHRVLKPGGIYAFTTEFHFGEETLQDPNNFVFSAQYLQQLIDECRLTPLELPKIQITPHEINRPLPGNIAHLNFHPGSHLANYLQEMFPHLLLLRGKYPLTSILLILQKSETPEHPPLQFPGREDSLRFLTAAAADYQRKLRESVVSINPFSGMGKSRFFADHAEYFAADTARRDDDTVFHSDYFWLGSGSYHFAVGLKTGASAFPTPYRLEIRVHRYPTLNVRAVECIAEETVEIAGNGCATRRLQVPVDADYCYAILGKMASGEARFRRIEIRGGGESRAAAAVQAWAQNSIAAGETM